MSITARLILGTTLILGVFWLSAALVTRSVFIDEVDEIMAGNLQGAAARLLHTATHVLKSVPEHDRDDWTDLPDDLALLAGRRNDDLAFEVRNAEGQVVMRSPDAAALVSHGRRRAGFYVTSDALLYSLTDPKSHYAITVATASRHRNEAISEATWALLLPMIGLLVVMAGATIVLVRMFLTPLSALASELSKRGGNNLTPLGKTGLPLELRPIAGSVNLLMQRLQQAMDAERVFAANSAHELRTPLAGALAQAQQLRSEIGAGTGSVRAAEIESALKRLAHLATRLLQLARADANLGQQQERQNLRPVLEAVIQDFTDRAIAPLTITVVDRLHQDLMVQMDADAFAIVLRNLIENAERHGAPASPITIEINDDWTIAVKNHGPVVAKQDMAALKTRFHKGHSDADGAGLGLAIAEKLITQSGGSLTLMSPAEDFEDGFAALIKLP